MTKLDIVPFEGGETALDKRLFHGRAEALAIIAGIEGADAIPSMEVVNGALKPFNDGLYAAVELEAEAGKRQLLAALAARLTTLAAAADSTVRPAFDDAAELVGAAQILAGETPTIDASVQARARNRAAAFAGRTPSLHVPSGSTPGPRRWSASSPAIGSSRTATTAGPTGRSPRSRSCSPRMRRCSPTTSASPASTRG